MPKFLLEIGIISNIFFKKKWHILNCPYVDGIGGRPLVYGGHDGPGKKNTGIVLKRCKE